MKLALRFNDEAVREECDGCGQLYLVSKLFPIGDGAVKVCRACYAAATAMVFTCGDGVASPGRQPERQNVLLRR